MSFTATEKYSIILTAAADLTDSFRNNHPKSVKGFYYSNLAISIILNKGFLGLLTDFGVACPPTCRSLNSLYS